MDVRELGTAGLTWRRARVLVEHLLADPASATYRQRNPDHLWTIPAQLLAITANAARVANWQRTEDATKRPARNFPDPILPPWIDHEGRDSETFGSAHMTIEETREWLGW